MLLEASIFTLASSFSHFASLFLTVAAKSQLGSSVFKFKMALSILTGDSATLICSLLLLMAAKSTTAFSFLPVNAFPLLTTVLSYKVMALNGCESLITKYKR
ncbi:hypothetical protein D3C85_1037640 [compost metagenome]